MRVSIGTRAYTRVTALLVAAVLALGVAPVSAAPSNAKIRAARAEAEAARERLDDLAADLEERSEEYYEAQADLEETDARIRRAQAELEAALVELDVAEMRLNGRANAIYRNGPIDLVAVIVGSSDFRDFVTRLDLMRRVTQSDASLVRDVKTARRRIESTRSTLERRRAEQVVLSEKAKRRQREVNRAVRSQKSYIRSLDSDLKRLVAEERERQEELARRRAEEVAEAARRVAANVGRSDREFDEARLSGSHGDVVRLAREYVGKTPYVWGGTTPAGFDCSGLVQYVYREIGIILPRTSRQQFRVGAYIPPDRLDLLEPGDLVFFGRGGDPSRIHHVAIFSGDGMMVHAPQTGQMVSETSLLGRIATRGDYVGGTRP